ncbi:hypothetical protein M0R45_016406 [Rubus argutus]|uniref:Uncharacterized protein n=1 Tax=Rubus argutus TaxID=59490 RepID=A0AAW1XSE9_RUBAR
MRQSSGKRRAAAASGLYGGDGKGTGWLGSFLPVCSFSSISICPSLFLCFPIWAFLTQWWRRTWKSWLLSVKHGLLQFDDGLVRRIDADGCQGGEGCAVMPRWNCELQMIGEGEVDAAVRYWVDGCHGLKWWIGDRCREAKEVVMVL